MTPKITTIKKSVPKKPFIGNKISILLDKVLKNKTKYLSKYQPDVATETAKFIRNDMSAFDRINKKLTNKINYIETSRDKKFFDLVTQVTLNTTEYKRQQVYNALYTHKEATNESTINDFKNKMKKIDMLYYFNEILNLKQIRYPCKFTIEYRYVSGAVYPSETYLLKSSTDLLEVIRTEYLKIFVDRILFGSNSSIYDEPEGDGDVVSTIDFVHDLRVTFGQFGTNRIRGQKIPEFLCMDGSDARSAMVPQNKDIYCFFWCLAMGILYEETGCNAIFSTIVKHKDLQATFDSLSEKLNIKQYYSSTGEFLYSVSNMKKIERDLGKNINVYMGIPYKQDIPEGIKSSNAKELESGKTKFDVKNYDGYFLETKNVYRGDFANEGATIRVFLFPYNMMNITADKMRYKKTVARLTEEYKLLKYGYKCSEVDQTEVFNEGHNQYMESKVSDGHFILLGACSTYLYPQQYGSVSLCQYCDNAFYSKNSLDKHQSICRIFMQGLVTSDRCAEISPNKEDEVREFKNYYQMTKAPFIIYSDTETDTSTGEHKLISYGFNVVCSFNKALDMNLFYCAESQEDIDGVYVDGVCKKPSIHHRFISDLQNIRYYISTKLNLLTKMNPKEKDLFIKNNKAKTCHFCECKLPAYTEVVTKKSKKESVSEILMKKIIVQLELLFIMIIILARLLVIVAVHVIQMK